MFPEGGAFLKIQSTACSTPACKFGGEKEGAKEGCLGWMSFLNFAPHAHPMGREDSPEAALVNATEGVCGLDAQMCGVAWAKGAACLPPPNG